MAPLAITFLAWQPLDIQPASGLDSSWGAGVEMAIHNGLSFGSQAVFTFGPLGFLNISPIWFNHLGETTFFYVVVMRFALAAALLSAARQSFSLPAAFAIAMVVASVGAELGEMVVVVILGIWAVTTAVAGRRALIVALVLGAFSGVQLLNKESVGIAVAVMTAIVVVSLPERRRTAVAAAGAGAVTLLACWLAIGQPISALPAYVKNADQIVSGYAAAMGVDVPGLGWIYTAAFVALALGVWAALHATAGQSVRQRVGVVALWIAYWFFAFKEGFVRADPPHVVPFFDLALTGFLAFRWRADHRSVALVGIAALLVFALSAQSQSLTGDFDPSRNVTSLVDQIGTVASPSQRAALISAGRSEIMATEPIDPTSLGLLQGHTVAIYPNEIALAWAYRLNWRPMPVLQSYAAYTPALDQLDADFLASSRAPARILMQLDGANLDGRVQAFDPPQTSRAMLCRYRPLRETATFLILAQAPDRCSRATLIATETADWGGTVPVPAPPNPHSLVMVRIDGLSLSLVDRIVALLWKPAQVFVSLNGGGDQSLVAATAGDGLSLRASAGLDFPTAYSLVPHAQTISVIKSGQAPTGGRPITYRFYVQSFDSR